MTLLTSAGDEDIHLIIHLLSETKTLGSVRLRTFVTSRPNLPVRLGFSEIKGRYQDLALHEIPKPIIEHDINAYLVDELASIKDKYNRSVWTERRLASDWPGQTPTKDLVDMANPAVHLCGNGLSFYQGPKAWGARSTARENP